MPMPTAYSLGSRRKTEGENRAATASDAAETNAEGVEGFHDGGRRLGKMPLQTLAQPTEEELRGTGRTSGAR